MRLSCFAILASCIAFLDAGTSLRADDWPAYRHDNAGSAITKQKLTLPLSLRWTYQSRHAPQPAWPDPGKQRARVRIDVAYQPVAAGGAFYFGSSADNKVYCLDAASGHERWSFFTGGPVRMAPAVCDGRVYVSCDDGWAYCLDAAHGKLIWKFHAAPGNCKLLGNGKMISRWPMRTNVLVDSGVAYLCAGLFPAEGVYIYAVRATDGRLIWKNDTCGQFFSGQPHASAGGGFTGVSPQGPLVASTNTLFVPTGRSVPAGFDRKTGRLLFWEGGTHFDGGGTWALLADDHVYVGPDQTQTVDRELVAYDRKAGKPGYACFRAIQLIVTRDTAYGSSHK